MNVKKMLSIAHVLNPVMVDKTSNLWIMQPITFKTMKIAKMLASEKVKVKQLAAVFPEDEKMVPRNLKKTKPLTRSIRDFYTAGHGKKLRKLPLIKDILDRAREESGADYFIYTNVDIALMPHFYLTLKNIIQEGYDAFIVNRRTIDKNYSSISQIPMMYAEAGDSHPGSDCFVFKNELYEKFLLGNVVIGCEFFGLTLRTNLAIFSKKFHHFRNLHLTFHIGDDRVWQNRIDESLYNQRELDVIFEQLLTYNNVAQPRDLQWFYQYYQKRKQNAQNRLKKEG